MIIKDLTLDISDSGKYAELRLENGRLLGQFLVHGLLKRVAENCLHNNDIIPGRPNIFRGEIFQLALYEFLDRDNEQILEKL